MIKYALTCAEAHAFESWFASSDAYETQVKRGFVVCPTCGSDRVSKQLMAPALRTRRISDPDAREAPRADEPAPAPATELALLSERDRMLRAMLREVRAQVMANTEDVGATFAEEARKIHYGEAEQRSIRGEASLAEAQALHEEGITVMPVPMLPDERN